MITRRTILGTGLVAALPPRRAMARPGDPRVNTTLGPVIGIREGDLSVFRGVRYGAPTRRFQPPTPPTPWRAPLKATAYGAASPQRGDEPNQGEDCLFLNVWTPAADTARRPVMVYIHGGGYSSGSGSDPLYDGSRLVRRGDVVVVTLNHRLNVFGYACLARLAPGFEDSGNIGQLDLILALRWIRDNIAAFGGDPERVMLFGQSGGGAKIATLMAMPAARGLFHRAATMSGQQVTASGPLNATTRATTWLEALGLTPDRAGEAAHLPEAVIAGYRRMHPDWSPDQVLIAATTAGRSWRGAVIEAEERARAGAPAWVYQLDFPGTLASGRTGAFHTADIPLAFDNVGAEGSRTSGPGARSVADKMSDAFIALARTGDPNHPGLPQWDRYELPRRQTMLFDVQPRMADDPRGDERAFFAAIPYVQPGT